MAREDGTDAEGRFVGEDAADLLDIFLCADAGENGNILGPFAGVVVVDDDDDNLPLDAAVGDDVCNEAGLGALDIGDLRVDDEYDALDDGSVPVAYRAGVVGDFK